MQRSLPSVGSLAHTTSRTTRTENPARCRLLDARLHDYTTPNTTRRPIHRAALNGTHALRRTSADNPAIPRPTRVPQYTRPLLQHPHTTAPTPPTRPPPMIIAEHFGFGYGSSWVLWFVLGSVQSWSRGHASRTCPVPRTLNPAGVWLTPPPAPSCELCVVSRAPGSRLTDPHTQSGEESVRATTYVLFTWVSDFLCGVRAQVRGTCYVFFSP